MRTGIPARSEGHGLAAAADATGDVTDLLLAHRQGDAEALDRLIPLLYDDLRVIARRHLSLERPDHTLDTTAVVHEVYIRLVDQTRVDWRDRAHFLAYASKAMRHILVDYARKQRSKKRGGGRIRVPIDEADVAPEDPITELLELDEALRRLSEHDERLGAVAECRLFGGMTAEETAAALDLSLRTAQRDWRRARAHLHRTLSAPEGEAGGFNGRETDEASANG